MMSNAYWYLIVFIQRVTGTEWSENWRAWPHCCGQARCWMHYSPETAWCECVCRWCRLARFDVVESTRRRLMT